MNDVVDAMQGVSVLLTRGSDAARRETRRFAVECDRRLAPGRQDPGDPPAARRWQSLALVMSTALCIGITLGLFPSLIALNVESRGFNASWNGLLAAMPALAGILVVPFVPRAVARVGALATFFLAAALSIVSVCLFPIFSDLGSWFAIRFAMGAGMGAQWVVSEMWVNRLATGLRRGMILSIYVIVLSAGLSAGPLIMTSIGIQGSIPFLATAGLLLLSCLPLPFAANAVPSDAVQSRPLTLVAAFVRKPSAMLAGLADGFVFQSLMAFLPLYFLHLGATESTALSFLTLFFAGSLILQFVAGYMLDRLTPATVLIFCCGLLITSLTLMGAAIDVHVIVAALLLVMGGASGALYTAGLAGINDSFSAQEMPSGAAAFNILWYVGGLSGPAAAGYAMNAWDPHGMAAIVCAACALLAVANGLTGYRPTTTRHSHVS